MNKSNSEKMSIRNNHSAKEKIGVIRSIATEVRENLVRIYNNNSCECLCAIGSIWIAQELEDKFPETKVAVATISGKSLKKETWAHCFVITRIDGIKYIIDVTATQFGGNPKVIVRQYKTYNQWYWKYIETFNPGVARIELKKRGWPKEQLP